MGAGGCETRPFRAAERKLRHPQNGRSAEKRLQRCRRQSNASARDGSRSGTEDERNDRFHFNVTPHEKGPARAGSELNDGGDQCGQRQEKVVTARSDGPPAVPVPTNVVRSAAPHGAVASRSPASGTPRKSVKRAIPGEASDEPAAAGAPALVASFRAGRGGCLSRRSDRQVAGEPGFEPGPSGSEPPVLPLNYSPAAEPSQPATRSYST